MTVLLEIGDPALRVALTAILDRLGVAYLDLPDGRGRPLAVLRDALGFGTPERVASVPVIQLWRQRLRLKKGGPAGNPFADHSVRHWLGASPSLSSDEVVSTLRQVATGEFLCLSRLLGPGAVVETRLEVDSASKLENLERLDHFFSAPNVRPAVTNALAGIFEETFTNAIFNAPVAASSAGDKEGIPRTNRVRSSRPVMIRLARDETHAAVAVRDYFGALNVERVIDRLAACYQAGGGVYEEKQGGAGLGFFFLLQEANRLVINVQPRQFTEVIVLRRLHQDTGGFRKSCPTLHLCVGDSARSGRRRHRMPGSTAVRFEHDGGVAAATACDLTTGGAFLAPVPPATCPAVGETIQLVLPSLENEPSLTIGATVRWRGMSDEHRREGFGVEFDAQVRLERLFPMQAPRAFEFKGQRYEVARVCDYRCTVGRGPGESVVQYFKVDTVPRGEFLLRLALLMNLWSVRAAEAEPLVAGERNRVP